MRAMHSHPLADPCGRFLPALLYHDVSDRLKGQRARAEARWGRLSRPASTGKLLWIVSGDTRASVRLGVELARAIVARRPNLGVTFTFEVEYPDLLEPLERSSQIGCSFGPADYVGSMNAAWRRLLPFAIVLAGIAPRRNLARACIATRHALVIAPPAPVVGRFERIFPTHHAPCPGATSAPAADLDTLLIEVEAEANFARMANGARTRTLWWWHGSDSLAAKRLFALFRGHVDDGLLIVSGPACATLAHEPAGILALSAWDRTPIGSETLVLADDAVWLPAIAASATAAHFAIEHSDALWQALASGAVVSAAGSVDIASPNAAAAIALGEDENDVIRAWSTLAADADHRGIAADASRRAYASERSLAQDAVTEILDRVQSWT